MSTEAVLNTEDMGLGPPPAPSTPRRRRVFGRDLRDLRLAVALGMLVSALVVAALAPLIAPHDPAAMNVGPPLQPPSFDHLLGTDAYGRDQLSRIVYGARISVSIALAVALSSTVIGIPLGLVIGYVGGTLDYLSSRVLDIFFAFPSLLLALVLSTLLRPGLKTVTIALVIVYAPIATRFVRGAVVAERSREYVTAASVAGASSARILVRHILPNIISPILVLISSIMAFTILAEAGLSYLGFGAQPPTSSWGKMLTESASYLNLAPYLVVFPGLAITYLVLALNLAGDGLRDTFDPRQRHRAITDLERRRDEGGEGATHSSST
jgi:peptide/nickel transport system permease protein